MRRRLDCRLYSVLCWILIPGAALLAGCASGPNRPTHPSELSYSPLEMKAPKPEERTLANGMRVFLMEDRELPVVRLRAMIRTGSLYEPGDKVGLAGLCGSVMRLGGTESMTGDEIDEELEFLAASVESSIGREMGTVSMSCHRKDLERCLEIFADVLMHPVFAQEKLDLQKGRMKEGIRRRNDDPGEIAGREFAQALYGEESPWARVSTLQSVDRITREDLISWHDRYYHPNNVMLGASGDFDSEKLVTLLEEGFEGWRPREVKIPEIEPVDRSVDPRVVYIPKDLEQATVRMGHFGYNRLSEDRFPIEVMNYIYGIGGFRSRLMSEVRSDRGLAYSVWGYVGRGTDVGLYQAGIQTKPESVIEAIEAMKEITREMRRAPVAPDELEGAVEAMSNKFVFMYDSPAKIVNQTMDLEYYGYPDDFLDTYLEKLQAVTAQDVLEAARERLRPDEMVVLIVGDREDFDGDLEEVGEVEVLQLEEYE